MSKMIFSTPTKLILPGITPDIERHLQYRDTSVDFQINKMRQNMRWRGADPEGFDEKMEALKDSRLKSLLYQDLDANYWTLTGLAGFLHDATGLTFEDNIPRPEGRIIPWAKPPHPARYYQREAVDALIKARHGAISLSTGAGKSWILLTLLKELGLKSVIFTPSAAITEQLFDEAVERFGKKFVGIYSGTKKQLGKLFTIATGQSLTRIEEGSEAWEHFSSCQVMAADESHTTPAETFKKVALGLCANAPYRFFVSATQMRGDGAELLLKGITGPIVYSKTFESMVEEGFLAKPIFKTFRVPPVSSQRSDPNDETRVNFYRNHHINKMAASIAQNMVTKLNRPTVIIIEEFDQFLQIKNYLTEVPYEFVHGGAGAEVKQKLPQEFWKPDKAGAIARFNSGETKILIGTSAIATGVDLRPTGCLIYLQGGKSEIAVRQGLGRGTRIVPGKKDFWVVDFNVPMSPTLMRHYRARKEIYETMGKVEES
jgi:superfamily II DNA or RNA helicase